MYNNLFIRVQRYKYYNNIANKNNELTSTYNVLLDGSRLLCIGKG